MKLLIKGGTGSGKTYKAFEIAKELGTYMYLAPTKMLAYESFIEYGGDNSRINTSSVKFGDKNAPNYFGCYASVANLFSASIKPHITPPEGVPAKASMSALEDLLIVYAALSVYAAVKDLSYVPTETNCISREYLGVELTQKDIYDSEEEVFGSNSTNFLAIYNAVCARIPNFFAYYDANFDRYQGAQGLLATSLSCYLTDAGGMYNPNHWSYTNRLKHLMKIEKWVEQSKRSTQARLTSKNRVTYDTIIIDEAHWASQNDNHSFWIKKVVNEFKGNIILVTAEDINPPLGFETLELEGFHVEGTVEYGYSSWINNIQNSRASLAICSSLKDAEYLSEVLDEKKIKHHFVYRGISEDTLIKSFFDFKEKGGVLVATNMAQQGINLPCDNLLLELNDYDTTVSISQKIGRVGRRGYTKKGEKNKIFVYDVSGDRSVPDDSTIESYKNLYKSSISVDWEQHEYNHDDVPPIEHRDHDAEQLLKNMINKNTCIGNAQKCA